MHRALDRQLFGLNHRLLVAGAIVASVAGAGCGAKTGLREPTEAEDAAVPDATVVMPDPDAGFDAGPPPDICIELPYEAPPDEVRVSFEGRITTADVLFLVDTTGSMLEEIAEIQSTLRETIVPRMAEEIPDVHFSVASLADFPVDTYGGDRDRPFLLIQRSTNQVRDVQRAVDILGMSNGADGPESQVEALYQSATGAGLGGFVPPARCPEGTVGYPCFRADGSRIFLLFTDASFHNGPAGSEPYGPSVRPPPHGYDETVTALRAIGAKVLGLYSGGHDPAAFEDIRAIARDTGAVTPSGEPIVVDIGSDGSSLDTGVIETVRTLVDEVPIDIDVLVEDEPGDPFDATVFVRDVVALRAQPPSGATNRGDRFDAVRPGTRVFFSVRLQNELFPPSREPVSYFLRIVLRGDRVTRLQTTVVEVVIPGETGGGCEEGG